MTQIFAHRGYSAAFPENTMSAFIEAQKAGADGIELDVQLTKDGEVVVIHDEKVDRTTSGSGFVKEFTYKEIRTLNANKKGGKNEPIPSIIEVFEWMKSNDLICNIELKNGVFLYEGMEEKCIQLIHQYGLSNRIIFSSFNHYSIVHCYQLDPVIETAPLYSEGLYMPWVYAKAICSKGIHPDYRTLLVDEMIINSINSGIAVRPYTVNKEADMKRLFQLNCSAFITDDPPVALKIKKQIEKRP
ncbi:MAG: glycerophosphodiester phosphodiesterase [Bacillota bacterium]|nr:glycerophosphodiester phosphodiesterase [Bacillota bacterium]